MVHTAVEAMEEYIRKKALLLSLISFEDIEIWTVRRPISYQKERNTVVPRFKDFCITYIERIKVHIF